MRRPNPAHRKGVLKAMAKPKKRRHTDREEPREPQPSPEPPVEEKPSDEPEKKEDEHA